MANPRAKTRTASPRGRRAAAATSESRQGKVTIRHYCQGIGDCHLLRFPKADGGDFWMLIDCGIHSSVKGGSKIMKEVVDDIARQTQRLDVIVGTHEHTDHLSAFHSELKQFRQKIKVGQVWLAWTENPQDPQARRLDKFKGQALAALQMASRQLDRTSGLSPHLAAMHQGLDALLSFNIGLKGERVRTQRDDLVKMAEQEVRYCQPSDPPISLSGLPGVRIYVLGPPRNEKLIKYNESKDEIYGAYLAPQALAGALNALDLGDDGGGGLPFDPQVGTMLSLDGALSLAPPLEAGPELAAFARDHYFGPAPSPAISIRSRRRKSTVDPLEYDQAWRRIDGDWLAMSADLAMQLDGTNNNTSLVLAFEFTDTRRVLLFAADAQVGSWLSWQDTAWEVEGVKVTGPDLLARTVYYKVGHHGSGNATLKHPGLDQMRQPDLAAFIPTNQADAQKVRWGHMPQSDLIKDLKEHCQDRVVRADDAWVAGTGTTPAFATPSGSIRAISHQAGLWVEVQLL